MIAQMRENQLRMTRRKILSAASVSLLGFAGCLDRLPISGDSGSKSVSADAETDAADEDSTENANNQSQSDEGEFDHEAHLEQYRSYLTENAIDFITLSVEGNERIVHIEYTTERQSEEALADEIGTVTGGYMQRLEEGWEILRLEAIIHEGGEPVATWHMKAEWFQEFQAGELTADKLSARILSTIELVDE